MFEPLLKLCGSQVGEGQADDHDHAGEVVGEVQSFGQFCPDDGQQECTLCLDGERGQR